MAQAFMGQMSFLSSNKQCQSTQPKNKYRPQSVQITTGFILSSSTTRLAWTGQFPIVSFA